MNGQNDCYGCSIQDIISDSLSVKEVLLNCITCCNKTI